MVHDNDQWSGNQITKPIISVQAINSMVVSKIFLRDTAIDNLDSHIKPPTLPVQGNKGDRKVYSHWQDCFPLKIQ